MRSSNKDSDEISARIGRDQKGSDKRLLGLLYPERNVQYTSSFFVIEDRLRKDLK